MILESDLAWFLGVEPMDILNAVEYNPERFPDDFVFRLTDKEFQQFQAKGLCLTAGGLLRNTERLAFTTHGASMLLSVFTDDEFAQAAIPILRAFTDYWNKTEATQIQHARKS